MDYRGRGGPGKFYESQVVAVEALLVRYVKESASIDVEKYLKICEQLGQEPDPKRMPLDYSAFPEEVQMAFFMYSLLSDVWDGASGSYLGKDWSQCQQLFDLWEIEEPKVLIVFMKLYERIVIEHRAEKQQEESKARERKQQASGGGGKTFTHNVKG